MSIVNEKKSELNERQLEAVNTVKGPVVIIARSEERRVGKEC